MKNEKLKKIVLSAIMIALATVLSMVKVYKLPLGGSITLLSMLPIVIVSVLYGIKHGLLTAFVYAAVQMFIDLGEVVGWGLTPMALVGCILFDYIIAFTAIGVAGIFRKKGLWGIVGGTALALVLRFLSHLISGVFIFDIWCEWSSPLLYSICYNGSFMLPELIITAIAAAAFFKLPQAKSLIEKNSI